jgi:2,5-diketo-D-gluconate reductase A
MRAPLVMLHDGNPMPQIGLGTWPLNDQEAASVVATAIAAGYRHIDTADRYGNERGVGQGLRDSGLPREEIFVTTKLDGTYQGEDRAIGGLEQSLRRLGLDYVDLLLIHWPLPQRDAYVSTWKTFAQLAASGKARSIGVSNFKPAHIDRLLAETGVRPTVNQIQLNPQITRPEQRTYNTAQGIVTVAWGPLAPGSELLSHPTITALASTYGKTAGQIVLRWHIELGLVAIPKSANATRIAENIDIFDFALTADEVQRISALDTGAHRGVDSDTTGH